jgi:hypothetical protein
VPETAPAHLRIDQPTRSSEGKPIMQTRATAQPISFPRLPVQSLFTLACNKTTNGPVSTKDLEASDQTNQPRIGTAAAFEAMSSAYRPNGIDPDEYLTCLTTGSVGPCAQTLLSCEAKAFVAAHFHQQGIIASATDVQVFNSDTTQLLMTLACANYRVWNRTHLLVPPSHEHLTAPLRELDVAAPIPMPLITNTVLNRDWPPKLVQDNETFTLYVPLVDELSGRPLTRKRALGIADAVLRHNHERPNNPILVFADESTIDSGVPTQSLAAITGTDLGNDTLGPMSNWTLTAVQPSKMFPNASPHLTFTHTTNPWLHDTLANWVALLGGSSTAPTQELIAAAELCLTPNDTLAQAHQRATTNLDLLRHDITRINNALMGNLLTVSDRPVRHGHVVITLSPQLFSRYMITFVKRLHQIIHNQAPGLLTLRPDDLFTRSRATHPDSPLRLWANLDIDDQQLDQIVTALNTITKNAITAED